MKELGESLLRPTYAPAEARSAYLMDDSTREIQIYAASSRLKRVGVTHSHLY